MPSNVEFICALILQFCSLAFTSGNSTAVSSSVPLQATTVVTTVRQVVGIISIVVNTFMIFVLLARGKFSVEMANLTAFVISSQLQAIGSMVSGIRFSNIRHRVYNPIVLASDCLLTYSDISLGHLNYLLRPLLFIHIGVMGVASAFTKPFHERKLRRVNIALLMAVFLICLLYVAAVWLEVFLVYHNWLVSQKCEYWTSIPVHHQQFQKCMYIFGVAFATILLCSVLLVKRFGRKEMLNMAQVEVIKRLLPLPIIGLIFRACPMVAGFLLARTYTAYTVRMLLYLTDDFLVVCYCAAYCYFHPDVRDYIIDLWSVVTDSF
ncbi:hypothetical protein D918_04518 [Trichuris suis]|nr:hypothetical protein D918_04518 [Trichuris suis]